MRIGSRPGPVWRCQTLLTSPPSAVIRPADDGGGDSDVVTPRYASWIGKASRRCSPPLTQGVRGHLVTSLPRVEVDFPRFSRYF
ncbi:hypothetical protein Q1695_009883 [Nippostrongylus brasiliensis]|nr:hypothetical protein Q1695_009883 [Nippostrongylus brasiliensis]